MTLSARPETYLPLSIASGIRAAAARTPDKTALSQGERAWTYRHLAGRINRVANGARAGLGLGVGERAAVLTPNCMEIVELVCGLGDAGVTAVMVNPCLPAREVEYILDDSGARALIVHPALAESARALQYTGLNRVLVLGEDYEDWLAKAADSVPAGIGEEWEAFAMHYTAGTTGQPKGVLVPHRSRVLTFFGMGVEYGCYGPGDRALAIAPMFHGAGLAFALAPLFFGGYCRVLEHFEPEETLRSLADDRLTNTFMVPTHFNAIFGLEQGFLDRHRRQPALKTIVSNAAPLPQITKERIIEYFGDTILHETYGSTEAGIVSNLRPPDQLRKQQCVGLPFPCTQVKLVDKGGRKVETGEVGELYSHSPYLFNGYWNRPDATAEAFDSGWLTVGDLARRDDEGYFYLVDRKNDMIISGGVNIYPREIEEQLLAHSDVREAAVVGVADDYWGEAVKAFVVLDSAKNATGNELAVFLKDRLASYKVPKFFQFIDALPRNAAGKVLKRELREA